jgi:hypothetical protein
MGHNDGYHSGKKEELKSAAMNCFGSLRLTARNLERKQITNTEQKEKKGDPFCGGCRENGGMAVG